MAPQNSKIAASTTAFLMVSAPEPTDVANAFATSLAPVSIIKGNVIVSLLALSHGTCGPFAVASSDKSGLFYAPMPKAAKTARKPPMTTIHSKFFVWCGAARS